MLGVGSLLGVRWGGGPVVCPGEFLQRRQQGSPSLEEFHVPQSSVIKYKLPVNKALVTKVSNQSYINKAR